MNAIVLPAGTTHVHFEELVDLIADALFPYTGPDDARLRAGYALANIGEELDMDARAGKLLLRNELTLGPHQVPRGEKIVNALVTVEDLRDYVSRHRKLTVTVEPSEDVSESELSAGAMPETGPRWVLAHPKRFPGYRKPLYDFLKAANVAGKERPTAYDVLDEWRRKPPTGILEVIDDELKFENSKGEPATATLAAVKKSIDRLTTQ